MNLISPLPSEPYLTGGIFGIPTPEATSRTLGQQVVFQELTDPKDEGWRTATDWLFKALESMSSETIQLVSITEMRIGA